MSGLFHRRTRSAPAQRPKTPVSSSAQMAANQAFLANRVSQGNLSASAAAAALRAMSPPPTQVDQVQTKRMQRRNSRSTSPSNRGRPRGGLERRDSAGSMTERTFRRSPSPGRPTSQTGPVSSEPAPPVPKIPTTATQPPPLPKKSERRTTSSDAPPMRFATSVSSHSAGRAQSTQPTASQHAVRAAARVSLQFPSPELERSDSRNSINFSYPRPQSPPVRSPYASPEPQWPTYMRNGITPAEAERVQYDVAQVTQHPVKKKKKRLAPQSAEGSHLSTGSMGGKPVTRSMEPGPEMLSQPREQPIRKKKKAAVTGQTTHFPPSPASTQESDSDSATEKARRGQRASGVLVKQPSIVREDWEGEQEHEYAMTEPQTREQQGLSPVSDAGTVVQSKKPLTAANMSRKIEEPAPPIPAEQFSTYHAVTEPAAVEGPIQPPQNKLLPIQQPQPVRISSLSPSRSTRFSHKLASDLAAGQKHEPLPRSVSPAKSAMKHPSPSGSASDPNFPHARGSSVTPSEASDSNLSADGSVRRKKSARVSFEPAVEVVGIAADPVDTDSPVIVSPQNKDQAKRGLFGMGKSRPTLTSIPSQDELEDYMKPRPQLPSFGSVRGKGRRPDQSDSPGTAQPQRNSKLLPAAVLVPSSTSSEASSSSYQGGDEGVSSDLAIGSIFVHDAERKGQQPAPAMRDANQPLPPEVTSVEGSGYVSDTESDMTTEYTEQLLAPATANVDQVKPRAAAVAVPAVASVTAQAPAVPSLSIQPPSPGIERENPADQWQVEVPGGFPTPTGALAAAPGSSGTTIPADRGIVESPSTPSPTSKTTEPQTVSESDPETSDHDSIYSDAAEDLSDLEGDGFGSIDAVVESPTVDSPRAPVTSPPPSPLADRSQDTAMTTTWDATQQRWNGIAQQTRQVVTTESVQAAQPPVQQLASAPSPQAKRKKKSTAAAAASSAPTATRKPPPDSSPKARNQGSAYPTVDMTNRASGSLRQSMRSPGPEQTYPPLRQSMRSQPNSQPESGFRQSVRTPASPAARAQKPQSRAAPQPVPAPPAQPRAALQKRHIPATTTQPTKVAVKPFSNDSDSESSFKKSRRSKATSGGAYTMRRSMRAGIPEAPSQPAGRGQVRSLSPPQRRPFSPPSDQRGFRSTMRGSMDSGTPTLRDQQQQKRSSSLFGKSNKAKSPIRTQPLPLTTNVPSRIPESDDEDVAPKKSFRSRFDDSSDDDEPDGGALRPVRGIPRRGDDGDSTDLEDSSDEEPKKKAQAPPKINTAIAAAPATDAPLSPTTMKKKGLFSRFRSRKGKDDTSKSRLGVGTIQERNSILEKTAPAVKAAKKDDNEEEEEEEEEANGKGFENMGFDSAAERDAMIAQTMARLEAAKGLSQTAQTTEPTQPAEQRLGSMTGSVSGSVSGSPAAGRLQRRVTPQRFASDSWPLPPKIEDLDDGRPSTADAVGKTNGSPLRPTIGDRVPTSETLKTEGGTPVYGRSGKKKRFPMLRKAFGLKD